MKLAVASISFPRSSPREAAAAVAARGFGGIEWRIAPPLGSADGRSVAHPFLTDNDATVALSRQGAETARAAAEAATLETIGLDAYVDVGDFTTLSLCLEMADRTGAGFVRLQPPRPSREKDVGFHDLFARARAFYLEAQELARPTGVGLALEIHHNTICPSASLMRRMVDGLDPSVVGVIYDIGNLVFEGYEDHRIALELLGPYLRHVHVKNAYYLREAGCWRPGWAPLDEGIVAIPDVLRLIESTGYRGWFALEDLSLDRSPLDTLEHNARCLRSWGILAP